MMIYILHSINSIFWLIYYLILAFKAFINILNINLWLFNCYYKILINFNFMHLLLFLIILQ